MRGNKKYESNPFRDYDLVISEDALDVLKSITPTGIKVYVHLRERVYRNDDYIYIYVDELQKEMGYKETVYEDYQKMVVREELKEHKDDK